MKKFEQQNTKQLGLNEIQKNSNNNVTLTGMKGIEDMPSWR